jgi:hypothetical protein
MTSLCWFVRQFFKKNKKLLKILRGSKTVIFEINFRKTVLKLHLYCYFRKRQNHSKTHKKRENTEGGLLVFFVNEKWKKLW